MSNDGQPIYKQGRAADPPAPATTRKLTPAEWARYGIRRPLRDDLIADLKAGLNLISIAAKYQVPPREIADKIRSWWHRLAKQMPDMTHAHKVWKQAAVLVGDQETRPPESMPVESKDPEPREEEIELPRPRGEIWSQLTAERLAEELETNTVRQVAVKHGVSLKVIENMIREYGLTKRGARKAAAVETKPERKEAGSVADALPMDEPQGEVAEAPAAAQADLAGAPDEGTGNPLPTIRDMVGLWSDEPTPPVEAGEPTTLERAAEAMENWRAALVKLGLITTDEQAKPDLSQRGRYSAEHIEGRGLSVEVDQPHLTPTSVRLFLQRVEDDLALVGADGHLSLTLTLTEVTQ